MNYIGVDLAWGEGTATKVANETGLALNDAAYKHREDLLDATLCAWTAALWAQFGTDRCQVLGATDSPDSEGRVPVIIAPARPEQRPGGRVARPKHN